MGAGCVPGPLGRSPVPHGLPGHAQDPQRDRRGHHHRREQAAGRGRGRHQPRHLQRVLRRHAGLRLQGEAQPDGAPRDGAVPVRTDLTRRLQRAREHGGVHLLQARDEGARGGD